MLSRDSKILQFFFCLSLGDSSKIGKHDTKQTQWIVKMFMKLQRFETGLKLRDQGQKQHKKLAIKTLLRGATRANPCLFRMQK
ncbi:MAG: hypothetical protein CMQ45_00895 [Gammaproteobacteria bacterium]|nr:hypothetical protein [Gammaproteobacteria bacterium]